MKKTIFLKIVMVILMVMLCVFTFVNSVMSYDWGTTITTVDNLTGDSQLNSSVQTIIGAILSVMRIIATGIALIMLILVAIKYMTAAPGDRADIKKHAVPFVIGAVVLFASSGILTIIQKFAKNIK